MKKQQKKVKIPRLENPLVNQIREHKVTFAVYVVLRLVVLLVLLFSVFSKQYENVFICTLTLVLFLVPAFFQKNFRIQLPSTLEIIILLFPLWDTVLHTVNGFLCAAIGFSLVDLLCKNKTAKFSLSPLYMAIVAFCFSMTIGVLWEMFEFGADMLLGTDMQKDFVVNSIRSVALDETLSNKVVVIDGIKDTVVNGESLGLGGYLDIGIIDTMKDLIVNFIGALVFSIIGFFYVKSRGKSRFAKRFIPTVSEKEPDIEDDDTRTNVM